MENNFQFLDIILFAGIAGFLLFRLRSVLGRRTGNERRRPDPFAAKPTAPPGPAAVGGATAIAPSPAIAMPPGHEGLAALQAADPSFRPDAFLTGARAAFEIIVKAFAAGDTATLQPLLSPDVFAAFSDAIHARGAAKETHETKLVAIKAASIEQASVDGPVGLVAVRLISDQVNVTRAADGSVVDGDPEKVVEKTDFWTFSRTLRAPNPNWTLVATHSP